MNSAGLPALQREGTDLSYQRLKLLTILLPVIVIGGFELLRHELLLDHLSMEAGNYLIIALTFLLSVLFSNWVFRKIRVLGAKLAEEQTRLAVLEERERLARDLHDHIAQMLFYLNVQLKQGKTEEARSAVAEIDHHLRQAIFNLRSAPDLAGSFPDRLNRWLREWSALSGIETAQDVRWEEGRFSATEQAQLFAIIQEGFANIRKHSQADRAALALHVEQDGTWLLSIRDNGKGIGDPRPDGSRYGLSMMRKRAAELGADFAVLVPESGEGTELRLVGGKERKAQ